MRLQDLNMAEGRVLFENKDEEKTEIIYPCFELKEIVEYYFEIHTPNNTSKPFLIIGLPNVNILFSVYLSEESQTFKIERDKRITETSCDKICGSLTEAITVVHAPGTHEFGIQFRPGALYPIISKDVKTLINNHLPLQKYVDVEVINELKSKSSFAERAALMEDWLLERLDILEPDFKLKTVTKSIDYINNNQDHKLNAVSNHAGVSNSTLNRYFKEILGVSARQCFNIIRFKTALKEYKSSGTNCLYDEFGYTDFSHFVKDAKKYANKPPSSL